MPPNQSAFPWAPSSWPQQQACTSSKAVYLLELFLAHNINCFFHQIVSFRLNLLLTFNLLSLQYVCLCFVLLIISSFPILIDLLHTSMTLFRLLAFEPLYSSLLSVYKVINVFIINVVFATSFYLSGVIADCQPLICTVFIAYSFIRSLSFSILFNLLLGAID